jgi:8-oxo-dGTP pyrophosphatase MutT (NUDIX family)
MTTTETVSVKLYAKLLILDEAGRVLVLRRSATHPKKALKWDLPGGLVRTATGERPLAAARREAREETGLKVGTIYAMQAVSELHERELPTETAECGRRDKHDPHQYRARWDCRYGIIKPCNGHDGSNGKPAEYCMGIMGIGRTHALMPVVALSSEHDDYCWLSPEVASHRYSEVMESLALKYRVLVLAAMGTTEPSLDASLDASLEALADRAADLHPPQQAPWGRLAG